MSSSSFILFYAYQYQGHMCRRWLCFLTQLLQKVERVWCLCALIDGKSVPSPLHCSLTSISLMICIMLAAVA